MCGRYVSARTEPDLLGDFACACGVDVRERLEPSWNVAPTRDVYVVRAAAAGGRELAVARWGLVPSWADDPAGGARLINARLETVAERPAFRSALRARRCLVPADGYYEWADLGTGRRPYLVAPPGGGGLAFAGLYEVWRDRDRAGEPLTTVTIVTTAAEGTAAAVHDRMPLVLPPRRWDAWLDPALDDPAVAADLLRSAPAPDLDLAPVHPAVGDPRNDGPHLLTAPPAAEPLTLF